MVAYYKLDLNDSTCPTKLSDKPETKIYILKQTEVKEPTLDELDPKSPPDMELNKDKGKHYCTYCQNSGFIFKSNRIMPCFKCQRSNK